MLAQDRGLPTDHPFEYAPDSNQSTKMAEPVAPAAAAAAVVNRGTGAGGAGTNASGKTFEQATENESRLLAAGFVKKAIPGKKGKNDYYLEKGPCVYMTQGGLKSYFEVVHGKELCRHPDEAYLVRADDGTYTLKVLEKKNQTGAGSVDTKLWAGAAFAEEYRWCLGEGFKVEYAFCLSAYLQKDFLSDTKKYAFLRHYLAKEGVPVLFGEAPDYYATLDAWLSL